MSASFEHYFTHMNDLAVCRDDARRIIRVNAAFARTFGGTPDDWIDRRFDGAQSGAQIGAFHDNRAYGHVRTAAERCFWIEWDEAALPEGGSIAIGRLNADRRTGPRGHSSPERDRRLNKASIWVPVHKGEAPPARVAPSHPGAGKPAPAENSITAPTAPFSVLLVEDDPLSAKLVKALLEHENCQVTHVIDGRDALALAQQRIFDMVFMDMRLPVMNGPDACRAIRDLGGDWSAIPIIALTANAFEDDRKTCLAAGMTGFVTKPIDAQTFLEARRRWTAGSKAAKLA